MNSTVQYITGTDGKKLAVIPAEEFEKMHKFSMENIQDLLDSKSIDQALKEFEENGKQYIPTEYFYRVLDGENPIRVYRQWRGYTIKELAEKIDISVGYLSNMERGVREGTVSIYQKLSEALNVSMEDIVPLQGEI